MSDAQTARPQIRVLTEEQTAQIHACSLDVLASTGVRVDSEHARQAYARATGTQAAEDHRVRIPGELVEWALAATPSSIDVYDRRGAAAFRLGDGRTRFGIGVTALTYQDPDTDEVVPFRRAHMRAIVRLGDVLPEFDVVSTVGVVQDVPPETSDLYATLEMVANTTKPLVLLVSDAARFPAVLDLAEHLCGDLAARPFVIPYLNPISPLVINGDTADKMRAAIDRGLPVVFSNYGMAGATTPITPMGTLALLNAELLAGLTLAQLMRGGTPVILGSLPAYMDMRSTGSYYDATSYVLNLACAEMMARYQIPHCGTSGSGMGWGPDVITSGHQWINHLTSCVGKVGLAPFVGDSLGSKAISPATVVYANEAIAGARRFALGFSMEGGDAALHEIAGVGPGGNYLTTETTLREFRTAYTRSEVLPSLTLEEWQAQGRPRAIDQLRQHTRELLARTKPPGDHDELIARGEAFIQGENRHRRKGRGGSA
ncbi:MAG: trimethylamine methyltransferase family protein [Anaerolineae bacterium]|nr:trimethylamine methyltransferase family protein [Anaerolineae bacterium]